MQDDNKRSTSATLLARVRDMKDKNAWDEFYARYAPRIKSWGRACRLKEADADDLTHTVLVRVVQLFRTSWTYDPGQNFSGLLRKLWAWALSDWLEKEASRLDVGAGGDAGVARLAEIKVDDFLAWLKDYMQQEELEEALARLELERPDDAILLRARLAGETAREIAERLGQSVAAVGMRVCRAIERLRAILHDLGSDLTVDEGET